jgi:hypothetical protein
MTWTVGPAIILGGLVFWARVNLVLPGIIALVLYSMWTVAGFILDLTFATRWLVVSVLSLVFLAWACWVGRQVSKR